MFLKGMIVETLFILGIMYSIYLAFFAKPISVSADFKERMFFLSKSLLPLFILISALVISLNYL